MDAEYRKAIPEEPEKDVLRCVAAGRAMTDHSLLVATRRRRFSTVAGYFRVGDRDGRHERMLWKDSHPDTVRPLSSADLTYLREWHTQRTGTDPASYHPHWKIACRDGNDERVRALVFEDTAPKTSNITSYGPVEPGEAASYWSDREEQLPSEQMCLKTCLCLAVI